MFELLKKIFEKRKKQEVEQKPLKSTTVVQIPDAKKTDEQVSTYTGHTPNPEEMLTQPSAVKPKRNPSILVLPTKRQEEIAEALNFTIDFTLPSYRLNADLSSLIKKAIEKSPKNMLAYNKLIEQWEREDEQSDREEEKEAREEYGDELYEAQQYWESLRERDEYCAIVFKRGKTIKYDIALIDETTIERQKRGSYFLNIHILLPKKSKPSEGTYYEWEKEVTLKPKQILWHQPITEFIGDGAHEEEYAAALAEFQETAEKYLGEAD